MSKLISLTIGVGMLFMGSLFPLDNVASMNFTSINIEVDGIKDSSLSNLRIYYIRHAEAGHNVKKEWSKSIYPESEWPSYVGDKNVFTPKGVMQKDRVSNKLKRYNIDFVAVSPMWRCKNTILPYLIVSKTKGEVWPELKELYATSLIVSPDLAAYTSSEKILGAGKPVSLLPEEEPYFTLRRDGLNEYKKPRYPKDHSETEKENAAAKVVLNKVLELIDVCASDVSNRSILLSGHGSSGKAILRLLMEDPLYHFPPITNTGVWMVEQQNDGSFKLKMYNDVPFLD